MIKVQPLTTELALRYQVNMKNNKIEDIDKNTIYIEEHDNKVIMKSNEVK